METARVLAQLGAKVIMSARTLTKAEDAVKEIKGGLPQADVIPMEMQLDDLSSVQAFARAFLDLNLPLHILICNAGVMACPKSYTKNGFETRFGVNHLGHFLLVSLLTERLKASTPSRIVFVSSGYSLIMSPQAGLDFDNLYAEKSYNPFKMYGLSKLANILFAKELSRRFKADGVDITVTSLHPGYLPETGCSRYMNMSTVLPMLGAITNYRKLLQEGMKAKTVQQGASTGIYCAVSPDVVNGEFYADNMIQNDWLHPEANDLETARRLWAVSEVMVGLARS
jgi:NAD(P)-dependent dehydrogenase (short-subunit alcohol dehydrogenase family)